MKLSINKQEIRIRPTINTYIINGQKLSVSLKFKSTIDFPGHNCQSFIDALHEAVANELENYFYEFTHKDKKGL